MAKKNENQTIKSIDELREEGVAFIDKSIEELHDYGIAATEETEKHEPAEEKKIEVDVTDIDPTIIFAMAEYLRNPTDVSFYNLTSKMEKWAKENESPHSYTDIVVTTQNHIEYMINNGIKDSVRDISNHLFDSVKNHHVGDMECIPQAGVIMDKTVHPKAIERFEPRIRVHLNEKVFYVWKHRYSIRIMDASNELHQWVGSSAGYTKYIFQKMISIDGNEIPFILRHNDDAMKMNPELNKDIIKVLEWAWEKWGKSFITKR